MKNLTTQIQTVLTQLTQFDLAKERLKTIGKIINATKVELVEMSNLMETHNDDIQELEGMNIKSLFVKFLGNKEQQLEEERQKYLHIALRYNEAKKSIELLDFEIKVLSEMLQKEVEAKDKLEVLLARRKQEIFQKHKVEAKELLHLDGLIDDKFKEKREVHEAIIAAARAADDLIKMAHALEEVKDWGTWDEHNYKYRQNYHLLHASIDEAQLLASIAKVHLAIFMKELKDVYQKRTMPFIYDKTIFENFTNRYFKNLVSDWIIQQKISKAFGIVNNTKTRVLQMIDSLKRELTSIDNDIIYIEEKKKNILLGA